MIDGIPNLLGIWTEHMRKKKKSAETFWQQGENVPWMIYLLDRLQWKFSIAMLNY